MKELYRGCSVRPEIIFKDGFKSSGKDKDILKHLKVKDNNGYVGSNNSNYISTSANFNVARRFGLNSLRGVTDKSFFIYDISPNKNIYCALKTLDVLISSTKDIDKQNKIKSYKDLIKHEEEYNSGTIYTKYSNYTNS